MPPCGFFAPEINPATLRKAMQYPIKRFKSLKIALKELEPFVRNPEHLQTGRPFSNFGGLRSRELLGNWLLCVAVNSMFPPDRLTFTSDPLEGDGIICDNVTGKTWQTEHVFVPSVHGSEVAAVEVLVLKAIKKKHSKGGAAYASGKTLVVFLDVGGGTWYPNRVAKQLPKPLHFEAVWVVGLQAVEAGDYVYAVTRLDLTLGNAPAWRVRIGKDFDEWAVDPLPESQLSEEAPNS